MSSPSFEAAVRLRQLRQFDKAEVELKIYLAGDPDDPAAHAELAFCICEDSTRLAEALAAIDRASGLDPQDSQIHCLRAMILSRMDRDKEALAAANAAIRLDPANPDAWVELCRANLGLFELKNAEWAARKALAIDPNNSNALNFLSANLRCQGKSDKGIRVTKSLLAIDPEDATAHANIGWAKMQQNDYREAEHHFRDALRIEPSMAYARAGLIESFKTRWLPYRLFLRWIYWLLQTGVEKQLSTRQELAVVAFMTGFSIITLIAYKQVHPLAAILFVMLCMYMAFSGQSIQSLGHFLMLFDRSARPFLTLREKWDGVFTSVPFAGGFVAVVVGYVKNSPPILAAGLLLIASSIPASATILNTRPFGRLLFVFVTFATYGTACATMLLPPALPLPSWVFFPGITSVIAGWTMSNRNLFQI